VGGSANAKRTEPDTTKGAMKPNGHSQGWPISRPTFLNQSKNDKPKAMKFKLRKSTDGQFYFYITASNGNVLLSSETYKRKASAIKTIESINGKMTIALPVIDCTSAISKKLL